GAKTDVSNELGVMLVHAASSLRDTRVLELLYEKGVDIETLAPLTLQTPLIYAANRGNEVMVQYLTGVGAVVNAQDVFGNTALHHCAHFRNPWSIRALLQAQASIYLKNIHGNTPL
ncbi:ankyrin repeat-containing domain protein, partial [Baffinella frigidus]